jgi:hypothetical protein
MMCRGVFLLSVAEELRRRHSHQLVPAKPWRRLHPNLQRLLLLLLLLLLLPLSQPVVLPA